MRSVLAPFRRRSLRLRITISYVLTAVVLTIVLAGATLWTVRSFLEDQRIRSATRQTLFATLFAREFLSGSDAAPAEELVSRLQIREQFDALVLERGEYYSTSLELTPAAVPDGLRTLVNGEGFGYEIAKVAGQRMAVFGTPLPPARTDMFLFFPMEDIDRTLSILGRTMAGIGLAIVAIVGFAAYRIALGILRPLRAVGDATRRVAEGLLETRLEAATSDEIGQLALSFNEMAGALKEMIERERHFVAAVSHELRTPLAALNASADVLVAHADALPPDGREALGLVREDLIALKALVTDLLEISEIDAGRAHVRAEPIRLRSFAEALVARRQRDAVVTGEDVEVTTDKARLERVLGNLVDNAYVHGEGRDVRVAVGSGRDGAAVVEVSDRGPGIDDADVPHLFDRFYKPDPSRTRSRGGVGLGLAIAKENASILGARIDVKTRRGEGTTFVVSLPSLPSLREDGA